MVLNERGKIVDECTMGIPKQFPGIKPDQYIIMPNHVHLIIENSVGAEFITSNKDAINRTPTIGNIIRAFKARCTRQINMMNDNTGNPIWQRNYYDHIIRDEHSYRRITDYIKSNPPDWKNDEYNIQDN
jgi:REP-associated tyrosine transposase